MKEFLEIYLHIFALPKYGMDKSVILGYYSASTYRNMLKDLSRREEINRYKITFHNRGVEHTISSQWSNKSKMLQYSGMISKSELNSLENKAF